MAKLKRFAACLLIIIVVICSSSGVGNGPAPVSCALDDDEFSGYRADAIDIEVGYFGGPYYHKATFTVSDLEAMNVVNADYTFIDSMPSVIIDHVSGVRLSEIVERAGIDLNSVRNFYFWTNDKSGDYYTTFPKTELIDRPRYCYYNLPENFDENTGTGTAASSENAQRVDTVIALGDDWNRCLAGGTFGSDYLNLNTNTRFRLIFGMTDTQTQTADRSAKWIHRIVVELGGAPTVTVKDANLSGKVGSVLKTSAVVNASDSAISSNAKVTWSSSDESIASVDSEGNITVKGEGSAVITASYGNQSASVTVNGDGSEKDNKKENGGTSGSVKGTKGGKSGSDSGKASEMDGKPKVQKVVPSDEVTAEKTGGVQNWRVYEMADDAAALPDIKKENPKLYHYMTGSVTFLFAAGFLGRMLKFSADMGMNKKTVLRHKRSGGTN